jgi:curved DNA-binding protein
MFGEAGRVSQSALQIDSAAARRLLGVAPDADADVLRRAFNQAVKDAHPDRPGGDGERLRQVIEAYRRLEATRAPAAGPIFEPDPAPDREVRLKITPTQAVAGGWTRLRLDDGRVLSVRLPEGLRAGDPVRISGQACKIVIVNERRAAVSGDDLMLVVKVGPAVMRDGGRISVETPAGDTSVWLTKDDAARGFARVKGLGLPARGARPAGDLLLRLKPVSDARLDSTTTQAKRRRFAAAWAA